MCILVVYQYVGRTFYYVCRCFFFSTIFYFIDRFSLMPSALFSFLLSHYLVLFFFISDVLFFLLEYFVHRVFFCSLFFPVYSTVLRRVVLRPCQSGSNTYYQSGHPCVYTFLLHNLTY